jgi:hypothetical protein
MVVHVCYTIVLVGESWHLTPRVEYLDGHENGHVNDIQHTSQATLNTCFLSNTCSNLQFASCLGFESVPGA